MTRNQIYLLYKSNPKEWTIRRLSAKFSVAMERIEGIIDLKKNQDKLINAV